MNIFDVLSQVESPFTDEEIINLTKEFIECNCDIDKFYRSINYAPERKENPYLTELYSKLFSLSNRDTRYVYRDDSWNVVASSKEILRVPDDREKRVPIYRIYLNAEGQDKARIVEEYISQCESAGQQYKLKYAVKDGRDDEILVLSYGENFAKNIELIEEITEGMELGEPAKLIGRYKGKIGICEEYIQDSRYSYTQTRVGIISIILQKYYLDHLDDFETYMDEEHNGIGEDYLDCFKGEMEDLGLKIVKLDENNLQERRQLANEQFAYAINITPNISSIYESVCQEIPEVMKKYMSDNLEKAMPEIIKNYRLACEIFGISRNGVFSQSTEEILQQQQRTPLQIKEAELSALEAEEKAIAEALRGQKKEGQYIGEE